MDNQFQVFCMYIDDDGANVAITGLAGLLPSPRLLNC